MLHNSYLNTTREVFEKYGLSTNERFVRLLANVVLGVDGLAAGNPQSLLMKLQFVLLSLHQADFYKNRN